MFSSASYYTSIFLVLVFTLLFTLFVVSTRDYEFGEYIWKEIIKRSAEDGKTFNIHSLTEDTMQVGVISGSSKKYKYEITIKKSQI